MPPQLAFIKKLNLSRMSYLVIIDDIILADYETENTLRKMSYDVIGPGKELMRDH